MSESVTRASVCRELNTLYFGDHPNFPDFYGATLCVWSLLTPFSLGKPTSAYPYGVHGFGFSRVASTATGRFIARSSPQPCR